MINTSKGCFALLNNIICLTASLIESWQCLFVQVGFIVTSLSYFDYFSGLLVFFNAGSALQHVGRAGQGKQLMDRRQEQVFSCEILAPGFARAPVAGTGPACPGQGHQCRDRTTSAVPCPHCARSAVPHVLQSQVSAPSPGALSVPKHSAALGIAQHATAFDVPKHPTALGAHILLAFRGVRSPCGAGSWVRCVVTHWGHADPGSSKDTGGLWGPQGWLGKYGHIWRGQLGTQHGDSDPVAGHSDWVLTHQSAAGLADVLLTECCMVFIALCPCSGFAPTAGVPAVAGDSLGQGPGWMGSGGSPSIRRRRGLETQTANNLDMKRAADASLATLKSIRCKKTLCPCIWCLLLMPPLVLD